MSTGLSSEMLIPEVVIRETYGPHEAGNIHRRVYLLALCVVNERSTTVPLRQ